MFRSHMKQKCITSSVHSRTMRTSVLSWKVYVVVISSVTHDFPTQNTSPSFVQLTYALEQLRHFVAFYIWNKNSGYYLHAFLIRYSNTLAMYLFEILELGSRVGVGKKALVDCAEIIPNKVISFLLASFSYDNGFINAYVDFKHTHELIDHLEILENGYP